MTLLDGLFSKSLTVEQAGKVLIAGSTEPGILPKKTGQVVEEHQPKRNMSHSSSKCYTFWFILYIWDAFPSLSSGSTSIGNTHKLCQVTTAAGAFGAREMWPVDPLQPTFSVEATLQKSWHNLWWVVIVWYYMHHYAYFVLGILNKFIKQMRGVEPGPHS